MFKKKYINGLYIIFDLMSRKVPIIIFFCIFATEIKQGPLAQLNRVFDYGSKGCRFESCRGHSKKKEVLNVIKMFSTFLLVHFIKKGELMYESTLFR